MIVIQIATIIIMALALSVDAMAVSISRALACPSKKSDGLFCGLFFGGFQGLMPVIGYFAAEKIAGSVIRSAGGLVAGIVLGVIGLKMLWDSRSSEACEVAMGKNYFGMLFVQAIATSIDALAVGIGMYAEGQNIFLVASIIMAITFVVCAASHLTASSFNLGGSQKAQAVGGLILVALALKALFF